MLGIGTLEIILIFFVLLVLTLPIGAIIYFLLKSSKKAPENLKKCSFCAELIQSAAVICRFCGRDLPV